MTYEEQLQTPEWRELAKLVKERDANKCALCFKSENLHVHHKRYLPKRMAWEYDLDYLITLCDDCHERHHKSNKEKLDQGESFESEYYQDAFYRVRRDLVAVAELNRRIILKETADGTQIH